MQEVLNIINQIASTSSRNEKEAILKKYQDNKLLKDIFYFVFNPYILTGLSTKKINKITKEEGSKYYNFDEIKDYILKHNTGTDYDIATVQNFIKNQSEELHDFYTKVFTKDLKIGVTADTLNKVYGNFIPVFNVMLAKKFEEHKHKIKGNFVITKKLDGNRIVVIKDNGIVKSFTRQGNQYEGLEEIESTILSLPLDNIVFDGELIADTLGSTHEVYTETTSKARSKGSNKTGLIFHIFDMLSLEDFQKGVSKDNCVSRKENLSALFNSYDLPHCKEVVPIYIGSDLAQVNVWMQYAIEQEWEGLMVNMDTPYVCKRTDTILKVKVFNDADVRVLNVVEGTGKNEGKLGSITIQFEHENQLYECNCGSGFSDEERDLYWKHPELITGKIITIGYFEISKNQEGNYGLRFPTWKGIIRKDKNEISMH